MMTGWALKRKSVRSRREARDLARRGSQVPLSLRFPHLERGGFSLESRMAITLIREEEGRQSWWVKEIILRLTKQKRYLFTVDIGPHMFEMSRMM